MANDVNVREWTNGVSMSFINFYKAHGPGLNLRLNHTLPTGEPAPDIKLVDADGNITYLGFSRKLGPLTAQELIAQKDSLSVITATNPDGNIRNILYKEEGEWLDQSLFGL